MIARIVNRYLATHVNGEPACSWKIGISQIILCASRSWNAQVWWPPIAELCAGHKEARPDDAPSSLKRSRCALRSCVSKPRSVASGLLYPVTRSIVRFASSRMSIYLSPNLHARPAIVQTPPRSQGFPGLSAKGERGHCQDLQHPRRQCLARLAFHRWRLTVLAACTQKAPPVAGLKVPVRSGSALAKGKGY